MATPVCTIDANGIRRPSLAECLDYVETAYKGIYGQDVYIEPDSQDGQFLGLLASAIDDVNASCVAAYNSFSPSTAQGVGLSSVVKINGISRLLSSNSTATLRIVGVAGTVIERGYAGSDAGDLWALPESVTIPMAGEILVTATCTTSGAISAAAGTIDVIKDGPPGWQEVSNPEPAVPGAPVETDAQLRTRQTFSAALPELSAYEALQASVAASPGVSRYVIYQNNAPGADENGIPGFSIAAVVEGGADPLIAQAINLKKSCGVRTYGTTAVALGPDDFGLYHTINFSRPRTVPLTFSLKVKAMSGFTSDVAARIRQTLSDWAGVQPIGAYIELATVYSIARMLDSDIAGTFRIVPDSLKIGRDGYAPAEQDLPLAYNEAPVCNTSFVTITVAS